ncbi:nucleotidyltransferase domain-containing protein [Nanoarchaeota archaeon]
MKFSIKSREKPYSPKYPKPDLDLAIKFAKESFKEFGKFVKAIVLFGSYARKAKKTGDIDVLVIIDDTTVIVSHEVIDAYRIITEKLVQKISTKLHVTTLRLTSFWEYVRASDPIAINILRDGIALLDTGFFEPFQVLLKQGRIRPTPEAVWSYFVKAPTTLHNSKWHIMQATLDLYWATIDAAHAVLMKVGEVPPTPEHVSDLLEEKLVVPGLLEKKYVLIMRNFYNLAKMITHKEITQIEGSEYSKYLKEAEDFVERMKEFVEEK